MVELGVPPDEVDDAITELALDLRWAWNHATDDLWRELEPELWQSTQNPWLILQSVSRERLQRLLADPRFCQKREDLLAAKRSRQSAQAWFDKAHPDAPLKTAAYFSMEYMLSEALPIYAGGLGNVAGDQLKAASDLNVPVIAIGLLYQQGYFRQEIDAEGRQIARYPFNDPSQLPIRPLRNAQGDWIRIRLVLPGGPIWIRTWQVKVGRRQLYLLDTNDPANSPARRTITSELYGGDAELRLQQEIVLGIGGWRLLRALSIQPEVCHLNEGHSAFVVLERARWFVEDSNHPFDVALAATRIGNLFTTHTAVDAGFDRFPPALMRRYLQPYAEEQLKIPFRDLMALGRVNPGDEAEAFNMAYLAMRGSGAVNAVSRLHGFVSRRLFQVLYPRWPEAEVPVRHVTNGVHVPTWDSADADALWEKACGQDRWRGALEFVVDQIRCLSEREVWAFRNQVRAKLVDFLRRRVAQQRAAVGAPPAEIDAAAKLFDPNRLTLGFARRFAEYKRTTMLLRDPDRLVRILTDSQRPAQLVLAGKAHPNDGAGQSMIREWHEFIRREKVGGHVVFLADYDMMMTQELVAGVDVWLNMPRRPWEACGTSGMKILANGGLNASELDGWWAEAYAPDVGWAFGDGKDRGADPDWDAAEANHLYSLLEQEIIPAFYQRSEEIPGPWVALVRESMARLTTTFSANRSEREYTDELYLPLAASYSNRTAKRGEVAGEIVSWQRKMMAGWNGVRFGELQVSTHDGSHSFRVRVYLGAIQPADVRVELYAESIDGGGPFVSPMSAEAESQNGYWYTGAAPDARAAGQYTPRIIPQHPQALIPAELALIAWQK